MRSGKQRHACQVCLYTRGLPFHRPYSHRVSSGAQIKIASSEGESQDRLVTITGTPEAVGMAQYLINSRLVGLANTACLLLHH